MSSVPHSMSGVSALIVNHQQHSTELNLSSASHRMVLVTRQEEKNLFVHNKSSYHGPMIVQSDMMRLERKYMSPCLLSHTKNLFSARACSGEIGKHNADRL